jgi:hypothetical protein
MNASITGPTRIEKWAGNILIGGFSGFVWGWYHLPDLRGGSGTHDFVSAYFWPFAGALISFTAYAAANTWLCRAKSHKVALVKAFAAAAVCTYYWYCIPELFGIVSNPGSGLMYNLSRMLPDITLASHILTTSFFIWFMTIRDSSKLSWMNRPKSEQ